MEEKFKVTILIEGYSYTDRDGQYRATGTSCLITGPVNVIVDTGGPSDKEKLLQKMKDVDVTPEEIDYVVCTHGHSDHVGNLNLFMNSQQIVGFDINKGDIYFDHDFKGGEVYNIYEDELVVIPTPGHMHNDVSVVVRDVENLGTVGICGDLFECAHDDGTWQELSEWPEKQLENRKMLKGLVDYIIPGHGPMFKVISMDT